jgi:hypothetical protein
MNTRTLVASLVALAASACATSGIAVGDLHDGNSQNPQLVKFVWKADAHSPERGSIWSDMPDGKHYAGRYYEVMENVPEQVYAGAWGGAEPYWPDWPVVSPKASDKANWNTFAAAYTGLAIATLTATAGDQVIRCRFNVKSPTAGLVRGGNGECKLSDGSTIQNVVLGAD